MFTDAVKAEQERDGTRRQMERRYAAPRISEIGAEERRFIETRTSAYLASVNSEGWPYVQHRGGPVGFLKVLGPETVAFADYPGNRQYMTIGNLAEATRVSLILMDYPRQARLKILAEAEVISEAETVAALPAPDGLDAKRAFLLRVAALDWNCPKYIEPRYTEAEIAQIVGPKMHAMAGRIAELEAALAAHEG